MKQSFLGVIPRPFRAQGVAVALSIFVRALLNFVGLAALLPILYLILDSQSIHSNPYLASIYERLGFESDTMFVVGVSLAMVLFIIIKCGANLFLYRFERDYIYNLYRYLSRNLYIDYFNRGLSFIKSSNSAVLSRNVNVVCYTFVAGVLRPLAVICSEVALFVMIFATILAYSPLAAVLTIAIFIPAVWLYFTLVRKRVNEYGKRENEAHRQKFRDVVETYRGYADIEINNAFPRMLSSFEQNVDTIVEVGAKNATVSNLPHIFTEVGLAVGMALLVCLSVGLESGDMKILFGVFAVAALRLMPSIRAIMGSWTSLRYNRYTIDIIRDANLDTPTQMEDTSAKRFGFRDKISIKGLSFRFEDSDHDTLHNLSFEIAKGEKVGINGRSGAGKTTFFNLLLGLYKPTEGTISIDGEPLRAENRRKWQNTIGYVSQSVFLTDSTLLANIALGCEESEIDMARVERAVEMASLGEFVRALPNGLHSRIGECGALLSGGQRQRIGIARALYKQADILFFDEATSALDSETEQSINDSIRTLSEADKELTIVIIAHRESSLSYCDRIITLK
ncbi:MAG: ABC transporter ATP-binding protein [Alistipes sp.]|nr:ABC transporter ATP-binding protein [Alistipes sp.]